jgi:hypothetical protein
MSLGKGDAMRPDIVLIGPMGTGMRILDQRTVYTPEAGFNINRHFLEHHSNRDLATITVYTEGRTPDRVCDEILRHVGVREGQAGVNVR